MSSAPLSSRITASLEDREEQEQKGTQTNSNVIRYLVTYDDAGYADEIYFCSDHYNHSAHDADGISGIRYERDDQGRILRMQYLTFTADGSMDATRQENYEVVGKRSGEAGFEFLPDENNDRAEQRTLDAEGKLITLASGGAGSMYQYADHNEVRKVYFDADREPFLTNLDIACQASVYDERGNLIKVSFLGRDGEPVLHRDGIAGWDAEYDERGNEVKRSFFGVDGEPVLHKVGVAGYETVYDDRGNEVRVSYFGTDGKPILYEGSAAGWESVFDDSGNEVRTDYFGTDGKPILRKDGYASVESVYDGRGNEVRRIFLGTDRASALTAPAKALSSTV